MKQEQIERIWNDSFLSMGKTFGDLGPESQTNIRVFVQAIEVQLKDDFDKAQLALRASHEGATKALDIMMRAYGAAVAWRDKYKVAKRTEVYAVMLVELTNNVMDAVGWHPTGPSDEEPGTVKLVAANSCVHCGAPAAGDNLCDQHREKIARERAEAKLIGPSDDDPNAGHGGYNWEGVGRS